MPDFTLGNDSINKALDARLGTDITGQILDAGYNFDFIDDAAIAKAGVNYKIVVLPAPQRMPEATKKKLEEYKRFGGIVIDTRETPNVGCGDQEGDYAGFGARAGDRFRASAFALCGSLFFGEYEQSSRGVGREVSHGRVRSLLGGIRWTAAKRQRLRRFDRPEAYRTWISRRMNREWWSSRRLA